MRQDVGDLLFRRVRAMCLAGDGVEHQMQEIRTAWMGQFSLHRGRERCLALLNFSSLNFFPKTLETRIE